ncbi:hypothetical protein BWI15_11790 [Kribbella sp. ALI-6-A]|uniref:nuclear transport factor 2 family protein n=1 Tax=Kribbella sp. ALI-6-A TaxID=1933817 RepID=UPI00097C44B3|nr:nuclear transport factor 2 family protein [Kribbella sp. ALI-6-A]ONI74049.1 hypothetical protein BWI15_11790 [Kribbella sp. ALI-6-A]
MLDLETLTAIEDIRNLEARYARYADHRRWTDLAALFTADGWFRPMDAEGNEVIMMNGRAAIAELLSARNSGDVQPIHQLFTHEIEIESPTSAKAVWAMADLIHRGEGTEAEPAPFRTMRGWGHYHVTYRKIDGHWLIATRTLTRTRLEFTH